MPFQFEEFTTPAGKPCVRILVSGVIDIAEAEQYADAIRPGAPYHRMLALSIVARGTQFTSPARKRFISLRGKVGPLASVVTSAVARAGISLILRMTSRSGTYRMFATEPEALAWLDTCELPTAAE